MICRGPRSSARKGPFLAVDRVNGQRGSSLMEVLIALLVFVIVASTAFKIIGFSRSLSTLHNRKQKTQDILGQVWSDIFSGQGFVQRVFSKSEREKIQRSLLGGDRQKTLIYDLSQLEPWLAQKKRQTLELKFESLPPTVGPFVLKRRLISRDPWLLYLAILDRGSDPRKDESGASIVEEVVVGEITMPPVVLSLGQ